LKLTFFDRKKSTVAVRTKIIVGYGMSLCLCKLPDRVDRAYYKLK